MKILLLGSNGQVGWELTRALSPIGKLAAYDRKAADLTDLAQLKQVLDREHPQVIVNAAAYTAVDKAETDDQMAYQINAEAVAFLAQEAKARNALLVHYSTDYVFDGKKNSPYLESDTANPQSIYGKSKLAGEQAIADSGCSYLIFRTSWVFAARGNNFAKTMLKLAQEKDELSIVVDQVGAPTGAELIADVTGLALYTTLIDSQRGHRNSSVLQTNEFHAANDGKKAITGIYHLTAGGETSWFDYAKYVITQAEKQGMKFKVKHDNILPIKTNDFPRPAKRPHNSRLDNRKIQNLLGIELPDWRLHVDRMLKEYTETRP